MSRKIRNNLNLLVDSDDVCDQMTTMGCLMGMRATTKGKKIRAITSQHRTFKQRQKTRYGICIEMHTATFFWWREKIHCNRFYAIHRYGSSSFTKCEKVQ